MMYVNRDYALREENDLKDDEMLDLVNNWAHSLFDDKNRDAMCLDMYQAALSGSINDVNKLLNQGIKEDSGNEAGEVKVLLEEPHESRPAKNRGGRVHGDRPCMLQEITCGRNTVLHIAAEQGHAELVQEIVWRDKTLLKSENSRGESPLHLAARAGNQQVVSLILALARQADIASDEILTKKNIEGDTVLHEAARYGHEDVVNVLMIAAPKLSKMVNYSKMSPLYLAVIRKSIGVVKALVQYNDTSAAGPKNQNALHAAILESKEITSILLNWKPGLAKEWDDTGSTPLHYAASSGDDLEVEIILDKMPSAVYIWDKEGSSPLHVSAKVHNYSAIRCMIDHCPDSFELRDKDGRTFLHIVAQHRGYNRKKVKSIIKFVLQRPDLKRLVNKMDNEGNTPLHLASLNGLSTVTSQLLVKNEADTILINNEGNTALDYAVSQSLSFFRMSRTVSTLICYGATFSPQRHDKLKTCTDKTKDWIAKVSKDLIIVSILIATIAFSVAYNVPGSYNSDGVANLHRHRSYQMFLILDGIAMATSMSAAMLLVVAKAVRNSGCWFCFSVSVVFLLIALCAMEWAYVMAVSVSLGRGRFITAAIINITSLFLFVATISIITGIVTTGHFATRGKFLYFMRKRTLTTRQVNILHPWLASYSWISHYLIVFNIFLFLVFLGEFFYKSILL